jgi:8-oxo-dGTP pyrophosphatase MutT (NUDIX family)
MRSAGIMLLIKDGLILGISRRKDPTKFGLIGGKFDDKAGDKSVQDAAIRETLEETGVVVKSCTFLYQRVELAEKPGGEDFFCSCYYATDWEGEPENSEEGIVKWLSPDELTCTEHAAFGDYNKKILDVFRSLFPDIQI